MRCGIGAYYINKYGAEEGARRMAAHGYDCLDLSLSNTESEYYPKEEGMFELRLMKIRRAIEAAGLKVHQIHGPWRWPINDATEDDRAERFEKMSKALIAAKILGAKYMAIHPLMPYGIEEPINADEVWEINKRFYSALAKVGQSLGVYVCLENMPFPDFPISDVPTIVKLVKEINHPYLKICLDTGHANIFPLPIGEAVRLIGKELLAILHIHDNYADKDTHNNPYDGTVNWGDFAEALFDIGFDGVCNIETAPRTDGLTEEQTLECELALAKIAKLIAGKD